jgi:orotidine-5'-phosphate decarboxylase
MDEKTLAQTGVARTLPQQIDTLALMAMEAGLDGVVASPHEARALRGLLGGKAAIVTPGIRPIGSADDDQSRIATPLRAIEDGASHLVIGRPITGAKDPVAAFEAIVNEIQGGA